jgi:hypothetical protein
VQDEGRRLGLRLDSGDGRAQRTGHVDIGRLVEADVAVADLHEAESPGAMRHRPVRHRLPQRRSLERAAGHRPHRAGAYPCHALQEVPARWIELFVV